MDICGDRKVVFNDREKSDIWLIKIIELVSI